MTRTNVTPPYSHIVVANQHKYCSDGCACVSLVWRNMDLLGVQPNAAQFDAEVWTRSMTDTSKLLRCKKHRNQHRRTQKDKHNPPIPPPLLIKLPSLIRERANIKAKPKIAMYRTLDARRTWRPLTAAPLRICGMGNPRIRGSTTRFRIAALTRATCVRVT